MGKNKEILWVLEANERGRKEKKYASISGNGEGASGLECMYKKI